MAEPGALVAVDIRADVTDALVQRIEELGGTVINSHPKYRAIRAHLPATALKTLSAEEDVQFVRPADQAIVHGGVAPVNRRGEPPPLPATEHSVTTASGRAVAAAPATTSQGVEAHRVHTARDRYGVDGTGIGIGVLSDGVDTRGVELPRHRLGELRDGTRFGTAQPRRIGRSQP